MMRGYLIETALGVAILAAHAVHAKESIASVVTARATQDAAEQTRKAGTTEAGEHIMNVDAGVLGRFQTIGAVISNIGACHVRDGDWVKRQLDAAHERAVVAISTVYAPLIAAALKLVQAELSPTAAAKQLGLGRSTVYRELTRAGIQRIPPAN